MNTAGSGMWGRLLTMLAQQTCDDSYQRLTRAPQASDESEKLKAFFVGGKLDFVRAEAAFLRVAQRIRASRFVFVPAVMSGAALNASRLRLVEYLTHQVRNLRDQGFDADIADIDTGASVARNGARLADLLMRDHRPTWVISHSKGGLDMLDALIKEPELHRLIDGWISFQSPFLGSPIADVACGSTRARKVTGAALKLMGADTQAISDLRTDRRARYMDEHAARIAQIASSVPTMCVATVGSAKRGLSLIPDWPTGRWMDGLGLENDGLVPFNAAILPGARFVKLTGLVHGQAATQHILSGRGIDHVDLLKALVALMLGERASHRAAA